MEEERTKCKVCAESIPIAATKCSHCDSFQSWRAYFPLSHSILALLVALVSVVSMAIPIIKSALQRDDSEVALTYIDRADVTIPIIASNKGSRPGVMSPKAGLRITVGATEDVSSQAHVFLVTAINASRDNLLIPENTSKQFFFAVDSDQFSRDAFQKLANDLKDIDSVKRCTVTVAYLDFGGKERNVELVIFDAASRKSKTERDQADSTLRRILGALECIGKIPDHVRQKYKLLER